MLTKVTRPLSFSIRGGLSRNKKLCTTVIYSRASEIEIDRVQKLNFKFCRVIKIITNYRYYISILLP